MRREKRSSFRDTLKWKIMMVKPFTFCLSLSVLPAGTVWRPMSQCFLFVLFHKLEKKEKYYVNQ